MWEEKIGYQPWEERTIYFLESNLENKIDEGIDVPLFHLNMACVCVLINY
jgi:hypothetical protein